MIRTSCYLKFAACMIAPTDEQVQCINGTGIRREKEIENACGRSAMVDVRIKMSV